MKNTLLLALLLTFSSAALAQKETFDVISYTIPKGWQKQQPEGGVQLFVTENKTGNYALAIITKAMVSSGSANEDFKNQWKSLLVNTVNSITEPVMEAPVQNNGWEILSGNGNYTDRNVKGFATLITATCNKQTASIVLMTNTQQYQSDLLAFINSLELKKIEPTQTNTTTAPASTNPNSKSLVGLWHSYLNETSGYINNMPQYTAGYFRKEYLFNANGTYVYRLKNWSVNTKEILFAYESGIWVISGSNLTLTPTQEKSEWWSKAASNKTNEWGKLVKTAEYKLEKQEYAFSMEYFSGSQDYTIVLKANKPTQRDGGNFNAAGDPLEFRYTLREKFGSLIDNPPGFKTGSENK